jgi:hypothetical protein
VPFSGEIQIPENIHTKYNFLIIILEEDSEEVKMNDVKPTL